MYKVGKRITLVVSFILSVSIIISGLILFPPLFKPAIAYAQQKAPITGIFARGASSSSYAGEYVAMAKGY